MGRIIHIAPLLEPLSPFVPGGAEQGLMTLAQSQAGLGFEVAVIAASGSTLPPELSFIDLGLTPGVITPMNTSDTNHHAHKTLELILNEENFLFSKVKDYLRAHQTEIALVHNHAYDFYPLFNLADLGVPLVHSLQLPPLAPWINQEFRERQISPKHVSYVSVSHDSARQYREIVGLQSRVIHYGVHTSQIPFGANNASGFLWVGRISPEKGLHTAIDVVCNDLQESLTVIGRVYDQGYFESEIIPRLESPGVEYRGHQTHDAVLQAMSQTKALVFPIEWDEPFGLVAAESLACGTPVIGYQRGALPEIVIHGKTGFLVHSRDELRMAICKVDTLSRAECRESIVQRFSVHNFTAQYLREYLRLAPRLLPAMRPSESRCGRSLRP